MAICVATCGDHLRLIKSCVESIHRFCPRDQYRLFVGANAVSTPVRHYLLRGLDQGRIDQVHWSPVNLNKDPMMRRLFAAAAPTAPFLWWFDDDSRVTGPTALPFRLETARTAPARTVVWGHIHYASHEDEFNCGLDVQRFIRSASWYRGRPLPGWGREGLRTGDGRWFFPTGGNWFARSSAIQALDWPDPRLLMQAEDILFGEAIRQQGWDMGDIGSQEVVIAPEPSRCSTKRDTMFQQMNQPGKLPPG